MINRIYIKCNFCKTNILLRFQMGEFDIPFSFFCPNCKVNINGIRKIATENSFEINNATEIEECLDNIDYYADFSVELPHKKISKYISFEQMYSKGAGPFMDTVNLFESGQDYMNLVKHIEEFIFFKINNWNVLRPLYDLYFNDKIELIREPILKLSPNFTVKNKLDVAMALHQSNVIGFSKILDPNTLNEFIEISKKVMNKEIILEVYKFIDFLKTNQEIDFNLKRIVKIYSRWIENFEKYIPMVMISLGDLREKFDKEIYGIATISFDDMINFYKDSYELILDMITIAIGLNNIYLRGTYDSFSDGANVSNFEEYNKLVKSKRLESLIFEEPFSKCVKIDRNIRNAIAHYTYDFDVSSQKITFYDKFRGQENVVELYLCDLALLCYDNITILVYLNELLYNFRKVNFIQSGMRPNIGFPSK